MSVKTLIVNAHLLSPNVTSDADAIVIVDDRIEAIGTSRDLLNIYSGQQGVTTVDLQGRTVTPGFIDPHNHLLATGETIEGVNASFPTVSSIADLAEAIGRATAHQEPGTWIRGSGLDYAKFPEKRIPTAADIDAVSPDHPVIVFHKSGHTALVNSVAMKIAGAMDAADPVGGYFVRDSQGQPTGYCVDTAMNLVFPRSVDTGCHGPNFHFAASPAELNQAMDKAMEVYLTAGITTVCDPQVTRREMEVYLRFHRAKKLALRLVAMPLSSNLEMLKETGVATGIGDDMFRIGPMKFYCDGALTGGTALFREPYEGSSLTHGLLFWDPEELTALVAEAASVGWQVGIHAQGDLGIEYAVNAIAAALKAAPSISGHRIEHCGAPTDRELDRIKAFNIVPVNQPNFLVDSGDQLVETLGDRVHTLQPIRRELDMGIPAVLSSDSFVSNYRPIGTITSAMYRTTQSGMSIGADQVISLDEAIHAHTMEPAIALGLDEQIGSLEVGKYADIVFFDEDLRSLSQDELRAISPQATMVAGQVVAGTLATSALG
jgi:predicted amidohydrolase YtcJ